MKNHTKNDGVRQDRTSNTNGGGDRSGVKPNSLTPDLREQLVNAGEIGPIERVSLPEVMITQLRGILLDIDPKLFAPRTVPKKLQSDPAKFHHEIIQPMLLRHPVLCKTQVRMSGSGLHVILMLDTPVQFRTPSDRLRWAAMVKVIQRVLPTDPNAPGITAVTRPIGSISGKNGATVCLLKKGEPIPASEVIALFDDVRKQPFAMVANILFGQQRISPCPACHTEGSTMTAMAFEGRCYHCRGKVKMSALYDGLLLLAAAKKKGA